MGKACFVVHCTTGSRLTRKKLKLEGVKHPSIFSAPKDEELFQKWKRKIPREGFQKSDKICEKHFDEVYICRYDEFKLPDGTIHRHERGLPKLTKDAIPTIFPGPKYLSSTVKKRKPPTERNVNFRPQNKKLQRSNFRLEISQINVPAPQMLLYDENREYDFDQLQIDAQDVSNNWTITKIKNEKILVFIHFNEEYAPTKCIRVNENLILQGFVNCKPVCLPFQKLTSRDDFLSTIKFLEDAAYCSGPGVDILDCSTCKRINQNCKKIIEKVKKGEYFQAQRCPPCTKMRNSKLKEKGRTNRVRTNKSQQQSKVITSKKLSSTEQNID